MNTSTRVEKPTLENMATRPMHTVQPAVPKTKIVFKPSLAPSSGAINTPIIWQTPVSAVPIVTALSLSNTSAKMTFE